MSHDSLIDELRAVREAYAARFNYDIHAICEDLRESARREGRQLVTFPPRPFVPQRPAIETEAEAETAPAR